MPGRYWVYILKSLVADRYYVGSTEDVEKRLAEHNSPRAHWTKRFQPWELVLAECYPSRSEAVTRERELKKLKGIARHIDQIRLGEL